ncbi:hypothetical protein [Nonomuraea sp. NPDC005650]|uniref:hypothetical protein n=1 Tax=Nonomuraea sp. NPDC005650 TaxID=3157045 RepID=UPI0033B4494B
MIVFVGVLVTYVTYMVLLLPQGYDLWVALAGATTTCVVAGHVTRTIVMVSVDQGMVGATVPRSLAGRVVAFALRAAMADAPSRDAPCQGLRGGDES